MRSSPQPAKSDAKVVELSRLEQIQQRLGNPTYTEATIDTIQAMLMDDVIKPKLLNWLMENMAEGKWVYELRTALRCLSDVIQPDDYLEIGVRTGWSLAQVVCECPGVHVVACDSWQENYGGVPNPGPDFVVEELRKVCPAFGAIDIDFRNQESRWLKFEPDETFDLITVDGSHVGYQVIDDMRLAASVLRPNGVIVLDDLVADSDGGPDDITILEAWGQFRSDHKDWDYIENRGSIVPIGIAIKPA